MDIKRIYAFLCSCICLIFVFAVPAFAAETEEVITSESIEEAIPEADPAPKTESDPDNLETPEVPGEDMPEDNSENPTQPEAPADSEPPVDGGGDIPSNVGEPVSEAQEPAPIPTATAADIAAIRQSLDIILYGIFPICTAVFIFCKGCSWFYRTFIESAWK